jgi:hypothetical protein
MTSPCPLAARNAVVIDDLLRTLGHHAPL